MIESFRKPAGGGGQEETGEAGGDAPVTVRGVEAAVESAMRKAMGDLQAKKPAKKPAAKKAAKPKEDVPTDPPKTWIDKARERAWS